MLFLPLQCRPFSTADPHSHFPSHLCHTQVKIAEPPGTAYLQELQFSFPAGMWASSCKVSQWKPAATLLEAVDELQSITAVLWNGGRRVM